MKKSVSFSLCIIMLCTSLLISSCEIIGNDPNDHTHSFGLNSDENGHFMKCGCGEIKDRAEHIFNWVIDVEPTYTAPGYKHKECSVCKYKTEENTLIAVKENESENAPQDHTHSFELKSNESEHFMKCECGEVKDSAEHILDWVIDVEPTYTAPGYKHKECSVCGYKTEENTLIEITLDAPAIDPSPATRKSFATKSQLLDFFERNDSKIEKAFLCFDAHSDLEKGLINLDELIHKPLYWFDYDAENDEEFENPLIIVSFGLLIDEFSQPTDEIPVGGTSPTLVFHMQFYAFEGYEDYELKFYEYDDPNSTMEQVIEITSGAECLGRIYYYQEFEGDEISKEWIEGYIKENIFVINR